MAAFVVSRLLGLGREVAISSHFGTSGELDAYLAAFRIPDILFQLMAGGAVASAFIPTFASLLAEEDETAAWRLAANVMNVLLLGLGVASLVCALLAPSLVQHVVAPGFDTERQALTADLMRIMLLAPPVFAVSSVFMGILNSCQRFLAPALAPSFYNLSIILGAVVLAPRLGAYGLALGVAAGAALHYLVQVPQVLRRSPPMEIVFDLRSAHLRHVVQLMLPRTAGLAAVQINFLVNTILASKLPPGSLATLNFAWMLMLLPQGIFAQGIATAVFPTFSTLVAQQQLEEMQRLLLKALRAIAYLTIPATVGLMVLREPIVSLVFQRRAFDEKSVAAVAQVLPFYSIALCAHSLIEIITRSYYALHDTKTPVVIGVLAMALNVLLSLILMRPLRQAGLALANSIATWLELVVMWLILRDRLGQLPIQQLAQPLVKIGIAAGLMWGCLGLLMRFTNWPLALTGATGILVGAGIYLSATAVLGVPEASLALQQARSLRRRLFQPSSARGQG